jgi:hypothetical protein
MARRLVVQKQEFGPMSDEDPMKTRSLVLIVIALLAFTSGTPPAAAGVGVSFGVFYNGLAGNGEWISVEGGTYAWRPMHTGAGWRPYWDGRWIWTDDGWYWDSQEPWAWATYHYGRWYYDDYYGWIWIPGYDWAPAWVEWRYGGDYVGWAPLGPYAVFNAHFGVHYMRHWATPYHYWSFVDCRYINSPGVNKYVYRSENNARFIGRTRTAGSVRYDNGRIVSRGPDAGHVERRGNIRLERTPLVDVGGRDEARVRRTGDREQIGVYRPRIEERGRDFDDERPPAVKEQERMPSLDVRSMDIRQRQNAREAGRDVGRMDSYRAQRKDERLSGTQNPGARERRSVEQPRRESVERQAPAERPRRFDRKSERFSDGNRGREIERRSSPQVDRPTMRSAPEGNSSSRPERSSAGRSAPSRRNDGERRGRR